MPWTEANGVSLRYEMRGDGPRTLVLLHEMGGCLESWDGCMAALCAQFRVLRYDMRGAGMSEKKRTPFTIDDLADDLAALLQTLGLDGPVALAGCAVGAAVALHFAARAPQRATGVVAMAPATGLAEDKKPGILALAAQFEAEGIRARVTERFDHSYPARYFADAATRAQVLGRLLGYDPHSYAATYRMLCGLDMAADFARISCPVLPIAGRHDGTRPPETVQRVANAIRGARMHVIDSGHAMPILSPAAVSQEILAFLGNSASPTAG